jgi:shikimate dehydrogenase
VAVQINSETALYCLIGWPARYSLSPLFWNAAFEAAGINAVYLVLPVLSDAFLDAAAGLTALGLRGFNVTQPYKEKIVSFVDKLVYPADIIGNVNTVRIEGSRCTGTNTDALAFLSILDNLKVCNSAMVAGSGGAAKAALWAFCEKKTSVIHWVARNPEKMNVSFSTGQTRIFKHLLNEPNLPNIISETEIFVNATSLGWKENENLTFLTGLTPDNVYIDFNYSSSSELLKTAEACGAKVINGLELLLRQGFRGFKFMTGFDAPESVMRESLRKECNFHSQRMQEVD